MPDHLLLGGETDDHNRWPNMSLDSALEVIPAVADSRAKHGRSKSTNHRDLLPRIKDGRSTQARRFRDLVHAFISDAGGIDNVSEVRLGLVRRLAAATVLSEEVEAAVVNGERIDVSIFCQLASTTVRLAQRLGIERIPRTVNDIDPLEYAREAREAAE